MRRDKIYRLVKQAVILSFLYLFFFENKLDINDKFLKIFKCQPQEVIYFKVVIIAIIFMIYFLISKYLECNNSEFFTMGLINYAKKYPIRVLCGIVISIFTVFVLLAILTNYKNYIVLILLGLSYVTVAILGYYLGKKYEK